ncbi:MAG: type II secretion system protein GspC [Lysobacteraceae bacterium]
MFDALAADRLSARLALWAIALAGVWLLWRCVGLIWLLVAGPAIPVTPMAALPAAATGLATPAVTLSKWHLFGNPGAGVSLAQLAQQAPATSLRLTLHGTFNEDASDAGYAIIADESGQHQHYRVGDSLPGGAELVGIQAGRVLLRRNGAQESLSLPTAGDGAAAAPRGVSATAALPAGVPRNTAAPPPFVNPAINVGAPAMDSIRAAAGTDIAELAKQVSVFPVLENGRFAGVRLSVGRDSDLLARSGLRPTDIITAVNGIPLDGRERANQLASALRDARRVVLTVQRDGQSMQITVGL